MRNKINKFIPTVSFFLILISNSIFATEYDFDALDSDKRMAEMVRENPGFGGFFTDSEGRAVLVVTDKVNEQELVAKFSANSTDTEVVTKRGKYDFAQLYEFKVRVRQLLSEPGVIYIDIDEVNNRIEIGVNRNKEKRSGLIASGVLAQTELSARYNIPEDALVIVESESARYLATLGDRIRPAPGGMKVTNQYGQYCTMGLVVRVDGINGFITNSHCTKIHGGVEGTKFYQPNISVNNLIGIEVRDPSFVSGSGCPAGRKCRPSDAALVQFSGNHMGLGNWGHIARPKCSDCGNYLTISTVSPRFNMSYNSRDFAVGDTVQKVGVKTGWTKGKVTNTCIDFNPPDNKTFLCQGAADLAADSGDSGSIIKRGSLKNRRKMTGQLFAGHAGKVIFSTRDQVEADIGVIDYWP